MEGRGFAFIDPHGDTVEKLLQIVPKERVNDIIYFNPADMDNPIGMNLFEIDPNDPDPERTKESICSIHCMTRIARVLWGREWPISCVMQHY